MRPATTVLKISCTSISAGGVTPIGSEFGLFVPIGGTYDGAAAPLIETCTTLTGPMLAPVCGLRAIEKVPPDFWWSPGGSVQ